MGIYTFCGSCELKAIFNQFYKSASITADSIDANDDVITQPREGNVGDGGGDGGSGDGALVMQAQPRVEWQNELHMQ